MFKLNTNYKLTGDQPKVIDEITQYIQNTLLGVTGIG